MVTATKDTKHRNQAINIRVTKRQRDLIDQAAHTLGKSRSDFMLDTACRAAEDVLIDQRFFLLDTDAFDRFAEIIDNPPPPSEELRQLMARKPRWE